MSHELAGGRTFRIARASLVLLVLSIAGVLLINLQSDDVKIRARYQMLACEKCYHMTVEYCSASGRLGETIIPSSNSVNIEQLVDELSTSKEAVCLKGRFYIFNFNWFRLDPNGQRFHVDSIEPKEACQ